MRLSDYVLTMQVMQVAVKRHAEVASLYAAFITIKMLTFIAKIMARPIIKRQFPTWMGGMIETNGPAFQLVHCPSHEHGAWHFPAFVRTRLCSFC